jgi:uncharacterized protein YbjT (DUF2867 family)
MDMAETILEVIKQLSRAKIDVNIKAAVHSAENVKRVKEDDRIGPIQINYNKPETLKKTLKNVDRVLLLTPFRNGVISECIPYRFRD